MSRIAFLQSFWFEFLGPMYISACLKARGHQVELFLGRGDSRFVDEVVRFQPDVIAFSCSSGSHQWAGETAGAIKKRIPVLSVMGGPHPTYFPEAIRQEHIDVLVRGEGEQAMVELVELTGRGEAYHHLDNLVTLQAGKMVVNPLRPLIAELDSLPSPDRELYSKYRFLRNSTSRHVITGRGCPYNCAFCCNKSYKEMYAGKGKMIRRHSVERAIGDIVELRDRYGAKTIRFDDEVFILSPGWLQRFLDEYGRRVALPFSCLIRADLLKEDLARRLKTAGCYIAYFGIESGNDELRRRVLKKNISREDIIRTAAILKDSGIACGTFNMLGLPGESVENALETIRLNQAVRADYPWCSILQPYPRTELEEEAIRDGFIEQDNHVEAFSSSYFNRSIIKSDHSRELENLQRFFYVAVKFPVLTKLIERLIRLRPNILFDFIFQITYGYRYIKTYRISLFRFLTMALKMKDHF
jgi:anaerobic magnesium-protoporphyrin IX monomethyl ester cyclase